MAMILHYICLGVQPFRGLSGQAVARNATTSHARPPLDQVKAPALGARGATSVRGWEAERTKRGGEGANEEDRSRWKLSTCARWRE